MTHHKTHALADFPSQLVGSSTNNTLPDYPESSKSTERRRKFQTQNQLAIEQHIARITHLQNLLDFEEERLRRCLQRERILSSESCEEEIDQ